MTWKEILKKFPEANFLQSPEWKKMNELVNDKVIIEDFDNTGYALMIVRDAKRGRYLEIPCGPLIDWNDAKIVEKTIKKITQIAKENYCVFVRIRPQLYKTPENLSILQKAGLRQSPMHLAAEHTVILDLTKSEEDLLKDMRRQTRYEVRRAEKQGIIIEKYNSEEAFKEFHKIQTITAKRQNFIPPNSKVLLAEHKAFGENATIYVAKTPEKQPIAYGLMISSGQEVDYYEAASTDLNRKLPGAYAIIWQATKDFKKQGIKRFNLWGIAPPNQPNHRYAGVTTFKTGFGGQIIEFVPAHDLVISRTKYIKNFIIETFRKKKRHL